MDPRDANASKNIIREGKERTRLVYNIIGGTYKYFLRMSGGKFSRIYDGYECMAILANINVDYSW